MIRTLNNLGYRNGRIDGYQRGKEQGMMQANADTIRNLISLEERRIEDELMNKATINALVIASSMIPSLEIGIIQPFNKLREGGEIEYSIKFTSDVTKEDIMAASHIIFVRTVEPAMLQYLDWANEYDKKTIYYIDDNFMAIDPNTSIGKYYLTPKRLRTYIKFLKRAKYVKVDSIYFANYIRNHFNDHVVCFPGSVDFDLLDQIDKPQKDESHIVIGYEGGQKESAFKHVIPALLRVLDYYGGLVRLEFFGYTPAELVDHPSVTSIPSQPDYKEFLKSLYQSNWDIGLAPLEHNHFNNCKTNNKFREYSACGIPGIYANSPPYADWITHPDSGYLVDNTEEEWDKALITMIENHSLRQQMRHNAGVLARKHFTVSACTDQWKKELLCKEED